MLFYKILLLLYTYYINNIFFKFNRYNILGTLHTKKSQRGYIAKSISQVICLILYIAFLIASKTSTMNIMSRLRPVEEIDTHILLKYCSPSYLMIGNW